jgi:uncharacterized membrane protein
VVARGAVTGGLAVATAATALACGTAGGVFFAFSTFVMPALGALAPRDGMTAMQSVNRAAVTPPFMAVLFGATAGCLALGVRAVVRWDEAGAPWTLAGAVLYLGGVIGPTVAFHVPRNDALAARRADAADAAGHWERYRVAWGAGNHVRTVAGVAAAAALTAALVA